MYISFNISKAVDGNHLLLEFLVSVTCKRD